MTVACMGTGIPGSAGIAVGEVHVLSSGPVCVNPSWVDIEAVDAEVSRFESALRIAGEQLRDVREQIPGDAPSDIAEFIDTHLLMLEDKALSSQPIQLIRDEAVSAEWALQRHREALLRVFEQIEDTYLRTRRDDLDHVIDRITGILLERQETPLGNLHGMIVLAEDLAPADVILMKNQGIAGFVTDYGGPMSHTAILARSLGLPAIVGTRGATRCLRHGERIVLDAVNGVLLADCDSATLRHFQGLRDDALDRAAQLRRRGSEPAATRDGLAIAIEANIELAEDVDLACANGASGVGLFRTEFLYMNRDCAPQEDEHYAAYCAVIDGMGGRPVTIRTLDLGADKQPGGGLHAAASTNPALGLRAIRLCLKEPQLFIPQLRAILRASAHGPVRLMLPMLTSVWEVEQVRGLIHKLMAELDEAAIPFDRDIAIGGMIEVPAAALDAEAFARRLDFLSIGTNDLIQYTLAIDRVDDELTYLYDPEHPAILRLIRMVIDAGRRTGIPISMCGEMAGDTRFLPLLLGMGLRSFSMQPAAILDIRERVRELDAARLTDMVNRLFEDPGMADATARLNAHLDTLDAER
jgi:phosphotransferase system enzyme I (PtsI)